ncbi:MAG TPA: hypothetical protein VFV43_01505, partial [Limnobacter sp.]|nr:hypothetical protein [Limnobacter sp.]
AEPDLFFGGADPGSFRPSKGATGFQRETSLCSALGCQRRTACGLLGNKPAGPWASQKARLVAK